MVAPLAKLGAYFSLPGYYAHERKHRRRAAFKAVPPDRLLIETDAPDQCLPAGGAGEGWLTKTSAGLERYALRDPQTGKAINHPANLRAVYEFAADLYGEPIASLAERVEGNFVRLFGAAG